MPDYGEVAFTLKALQVAALSSGGTYGTPVALDYEQTLTIEPQADTQEIKSRGLLKKLLTVITHANLSFQEAKINEDALAIIAGMTSSTSGSTPNELTQARLAAGGAGLPRFGLIGRLVSEDGAGDLVGLPDCKLDTAPALTINQNEFVMQEVAGRAVANGDDKLVFTDFYEDESDIGTINFDVFFS